MRKHEIPRESKNEGRILYFFTGRSILTTVIGIGLGFIIGSFLKVALSTWALIISLILFGGIGFLIGTVKIPEMASVPITKSLSGIYIDEAVVRYIAFKKRRSLKVLERED